jgi:hypothetical protein
VVSDVTKIDLLVLLEERIFFSLKGLNYRNLGMNDAAEGDKVSPNQGDLLDSLRNGLGEDNVLNVINVLGEFIQYRKTRVNQSIEDVIEKESRAAPQVTFAAILVSLAFLEESDQRFEVTGTMNGNDIILTNKDIYFTGPGYAIFFVKYRDMQYHEKVVFILINFGTLYAAEDIIQIQRMKLEALSQELDFIGSRSFDIEPTQLAIGN